jgi:hypothetical protein
MTRWSHGWHPWRGLLGLLLSTLATLVAAGGCASTSAVLLPTSSRELVMAYDDAHATGSLAFPSETYESVVRFQLPEGAHKPLRLRFQAEAPGKIEINIYGSTPLETPGPAIRTFTHELSTADISDGRDGRWVVEQLGDLQSLEGIVWVGMRKTEGKPSIWACNVTSGQAFMRDNNPQNPMGLIPTRRTPMLRIELVP